MIHPDTTPFAPPQRTFSEMDRDEIVRQTLREIDRRLTALNVNSLYEQAFKVVRRVMREMKP